MSLTTPASRAELVPERNTACTVERLGVRRFGKTGPYELPVDRYAREAQPLVQIAVCAYA